MRFTSLLLMACALGAAGYIGYVKLQPKTATEVAKPKAAQGPVAVEAMRVKSKKLEITLATVGTLKANESLMLRPEITGRIDNIPFAEGTAAKKGELLISIDDRVYAAELKQAEAAYELARVNYARAKMLKEKGAGTISNFDTQLANMNVAKAQVELSRAQLDKTKIIAPFDGIMGLRHVSPGDYVNPGQDLASFQSNNPIKAEFTLPENATGAVAAGQNIDVLVDALPGRSFTGKVYAIDPQVDSTNRNIALRALITNDDDVLKPGMFARVSLITAEKPDALFVPESAIIPRGNESFVIKIDAAKKVATVPVTIGERKNGEVEIIKGLAVDDTVITAGHLKVRDGAEVSYTLP
jgi:membrane fusion protein (multidrug efflux system)